MNLELILREKQLKVTSKRMALLRLLSQETKYTSPEELFQKLLPEFPSLALTTIYRNLEELHNQGVIMQVLRNNRQLYYFFCNSCNKKNHHHHFICDSCKSVFALDSCFKNEIEKELKKNKLGKMTSHILQANGVCSNCLSKS